MSLRFSRPAVLSGGCAHAEPPPRAYLTLIIDDLGQNLPRDRRVLALPGPVTTAIMPDTPHATEFAREAHRAGKIVILHMPMDPATGPYAWHPELPLEELRPDAAFKGALHRRHQQPHGQPHDRSAAGDGLADGRVAAPQVLRRQPHQRADRGGAEAQKIGLASVSRDVFLDDERTEAAIFTQLQTAISLARKQGSAVMIGHPYPQTLAVLERELPKLKAGHRLDRHQADDQRAQQSRHRRPWQGRRLPLNSLARYT
jgi:polysaccharide deacetylase 2 family uncharacterized protein YibQ